MTKQLNFVAHKSNYLKPLSPRTAFLLLDDGYWEKPLVTDPEITVLGLPSKITLS